ncbi:hypothetical protein GCM10027288_56110 [Bordetella tumbae]
MDKNPSFRLSRFPLGKPAARRTRLMGAAIVVPRAAGVLSAMWSDSGPSVERCNQNDMLSGYGYR